MPKGVGYPSAKMEKEMELESDLRTLTRAQEIMKNKTRLKEVLAFAKKKAKEAETTVENLDGLRR